MTTRKKDSIIITSGGVALLLLMAIMNLLPPDEMSPIGILAVFGLIYLMCLAGVLIISHLVAVILGGFNVKPRKTTKSTKKYLYLAVISAFPVIILAIQSIHNVSFIDVTLLIIMTAVICLYIKRH